jgi:hypothetical protein
LRGHWTNWSSSNQPTEDKWKLTHRTPLALAFVETELRRLRCHDNSRDEIKKKHISLLCLLTPNEVRLWAIQESEPTPLSATKQSTCHDNGHPLFPSSAPIVHLCVPGFYLRSSLHVPISVIHWPSTLCPLNSVAPELSPCSQEPATGSYPEPTESTPPTPQPVSLRSILIPSSHLRLCLLGFSLKILYFYAFKILYMKMGCNMGSKIKIKAKQSRCRPWRRLEGEEI